MNKKRHRTKSLKQAIKDKELQLAKLKMHVDKSTICSDLYNRMVLEKAILGKELQDLEKKQFYHNREKHYSAQKSPHLRLLQIGKR